MAGKKAARLICKSGYRTVAPGRTVGPGTSFTESEEPKMFNRIVKAGAFATDEVLVDEKHPFLLVDPDPEHLEIELARRGDTIDDAIEKKQRELEAEQERLKKEAEAAKARLAAIEKKRAERQKRKEALKAKRRKELAKKKEDEDQLLIAEVEKELEEEMNDSKPTGRKPSGKK